MYCAIHKCEECKNKSCNDSAAEKYKKLDAKGKDEFKKKYLCEQVNGLCHLNECPSFERCTKQEKTNYIIWRKRYKNKNTELCKKVLNIKGGR